MRVERVFAALCISLGARSLAAADRDIVLNEIHYHPPAGETGEFIEIANRGKEPAVLDGFRFTRGIDFTFPPGTSIPPGGFLVLTGDREAFLRSRPRAGLLAVGNYAATLKNSGETLELVDSSGAVVDRVRYGDRAPFPTVPDGGGPTLERRSPGAPGDLPHNWRSSVPTWEPIQARAAFHASTFTIHLIASGEVLIDDLLVTRQGSSDPLIPDGGFERGIDGWVFSGTHGGSRHETLEVHSGSGALRLVSTGRGTPAQARFEIQPPLADGTEVSISFMVKWVRGTNRFDFGSRKDLLGPVDLLGTPGAPNSILAEDLPPWIASAGHEPRAPTSRDEVILLAAVVAEGGVASVAARLHDGSKEETVELLDDGRSGDGAAGDGVYGARLGRRPHGTIVRYRIEARDGAGGVDSFPIPGEPTSARAYRVDDRPSDSRLPVFAMFLPPESLDRLATQPIIYQAGTLVFAGEVYDLRIGLDGKPDQGLGAGGNYGRHGFRHRGSNSLGNPKQPWKVKFLKDRLFDRGDPRRFGEPRRKVNFNPLWTNKDFLREHLAHRAFEELRAPNCYSEHVRLELNGEFFGLYLHIEQTDEAFLRRNGLDDQGELWKSTSGTAQSTSGYEKKTALSSGNAALADFISGLARLRTDDDRERFVDQRIDVPAFLDYLVATAVISNADQPHKNHYMFRDSASGLWTQTPWDLDLTWGQNHECEGTCSGGMLPPGGTGRDCLRWKNHILLGTRLHQKCDDKWNLMTDTFLVSERHNGLFRDRIREAAGAYLTGEHLDPIIDELRDRTHEEAALDRARWGSWGNPITWDVDERIAELKRWIDLRRKFILASLPEPLSGLACGLGPGRTLAISWQGGGTYKKVLVRVGSPGERGALAASLPGDARSASVPLTGTSPGEVEVTVSALGMEDIYTPGIACEVSVPEVSFIRADATGDGEAGLPDVLGLLAYLFEGAASSCPAALDVDLDGKIAISDPIYLLRFLFRSGSPPRPPFPDCGRGEKTFECASHEGCRG